MTPSEESLFCCGYCKKDFKRDKYAYIKGGGFKSIILMCNQCRKKYHRNLKVRKMKNE